MDKFFGNLHAVLGAGLVLSIVLMLGLNGQNFEDGMAAANAVMRWLHTFFGVLWIGLLYYFNFVQIPTMPKIPAELKPAVGKHIAPAAAVLVPLGGAGRPWCWASRLRATRNIWRPRWGFQDPYKLIGAGMWLGLIMAFNVWFVIWPNQKKALGIVEADDATKAKAAKTAMIFSRTNTLLSIPMLYAMVNANFS